MAGAVASQRSRAPHATRALGNDDRAVRLYFSSAVMSDPDPATKLAVGDAKRGENMFLKHDAACVLCHSLKAQGSTVGPALDGIATRKDEACIRQSLFEPSAALSEGFQQLKISPMPPMGDIFSPQELADIQAFVQVLK